MRVTGLHLDMKCLNFVIYVVGIMNKNGKLSWYFELLPCRFFINAIDFLSGWSTWCFFFSNGKSLYLSDENVNNVWQQIYWNIQIGCGLNEKESRNVLMRARCSDISDWVFLCMQTFLWPIKIIFHLSTYYFKWQVSFWATLEYWINSNKIYNTL